MRSLPKKIEYYEENVVAGGQSATLRIQAQRSGELPRDFQWRLSDARNQMIGRLLQVRPHLREPVTERSGLADQHALQLIMQERNVRTTEDLLQVLTRDKPKHHNKYWKFSKKPTR